MEKKSTQQNEMYRGYCFLEDGEYCPPIPFVNLAQAIHYLNLQRLLQYRVIIVDDSDCIIAEAIKGVITFPESVEAANEH